MRFLICLLLAAASCAHAETSSYNKGVEAWRINDYAEARKQWSQSLAEGGPDEALNNLAYLLYYGLGGDAQPDKAVELWRKGAALAVSEAQLHLGHAYEKGNGTERNPATAYAWYRCAIATAHALSTDDATEKQIERDAITALSSLERGLSAEHRNDGEALAAVLIAKYSVRLSP
jgi:TPR repeat protein